MAALAATLLAVPSAQAARRKAPKRLEEVLLLGSQPLSDTAWMLSGWAQSKRYRLSTEQALPWLERYLRPSLNHTPDWRRFWYGRYGSRSWHFAPSFTWLLSTDAASEPSLQPMLGAQPFELSRPEPFEPLAVDDIDVAPLWALDLEAVPEPRGLSMAPSRPCPAWKAPRPVTVMRTAGERDHFALLDCEGGIAPEAVDRLSVLARQAEVPRPDLPLPLEPVAGDEWLPHVRLLDPRLVWLVQKVAEVFPARPIVLMSGYRGVHSGLHHKGRALDLYVHGVPNEQLFALCKSLRDVGCGYYPNSRFVHVDVRPYATGRVLWVDVSEPGHPSRYVDGWAGVVGPGEVWLGD